MNQIQLEDDLYTAVREGNFSLESLHREDQTVYLLGEVHFKRKACKELGQQVISHFDNQETAAIGVEGADFNNYPRVIRWIINTTITPFYWILAKVLNTSSIDATKDYKVVKFYLEEKHKPHWREYLFFILLPLLVIWNMAILFWLPEDNPGVRAVNQLILLGVFYEIVATMTGILPSLFFGGLTVARDRTMADAIIERSAIYPTILVICGKAHLPGIAKHLKEDGFSSLADIQKRCECVCNCGARTGARTPNNTSTEFAKPLSLWAVGYKEAYAQCLSVGPIKKGQLISVWGLERDDNGYYYTNAEPAQKGSRFASLRGIALDDLKAGERGTFQKFFKYYDRPDENCNVRFVKAFSREEAIQYLINWDRWEGNLPDNYVFDALPLNRLGVLNIEAGKLNNSSLIEGSFNFQPIFKVQCVKDNVCITDIVESNEISSCC